MYGKKVKLRILFISLLLISVILSIFLILKSLEENVVYFFSPTEIKSLTEIKNKKSLGENPGPFKGISIYPVILSVATRRPFGLLFVPKIHKGGSWPKAIFRGTFNFESNFAPSCRGKRLHGFRHRCRSWS